jgi:hypothetical protein
VLDQSGLIDRVAHQNKKIGLLRFAHGKPCYPPLTGGRKATSSPEWSGVLHAANS